MIVLISPAKTMNYDYQWDKGHFTIPENLDRSERLIAKLRKMHPGKIRSLMGISDALAELNVARYREWSSDFNAENAGPAVLTFNGEVYHGLMARTFNQDDLTFAQEHLRILSGLHGILKPLDLVSPYRLEMGIPIGYRIDNLYDYWGKTVKSHLKDLMKTRDSHWVINLASEEYFKVTGLKRKDPNVITPVFKELRGDRLQLITIYAKKARGMLTRFIIKNRIENPEDLKKFDLEGYCFTPRYSKSNEWVFTR